MKKLLFIPVAVLFILSLLLGGCAQKEYSLTIKVNGEGNVTPAAGEYTYQEGESINAKAMPASGWKFDGWTGDASGSNATIEILMDKAKEVTANFSRITHTLTISENGEGTTNPSAGTYTYDEGTVVSIKATPASKWKFDQWSGDVASVTSATTTVTMDSDKTLVATFLNNTYSLDISISGEGTTNPSAGTYTYNEGTVVNVTAIPTDDSKFDNWSGDVASSTSATTTVTMDSDQTLVANFSRNHYELTVSMNGSGTITPRAGTYTYNTGAVVNLTAIPASGWKFDNWSGGVASPTSATTTVTIDSDKTVVANFSKSSYTLSISVNGSGYTYPSAGIYNYPAGTVINLAATPASDWKFGYWSGDVASPTSATTTVIMDDDKTIVANFSLAQKDYGPLTLNINSGSGDFTIPSLYTGDRVDFNFTAVGYGVSFSVIDPDGNIIFEGNGDNNIWSGEGSFVATVSGNYKIHFTTVGPFAQSTITISYTVYYAE